MSQPSSPVPDFDLTAGQVLALRYSSLFASAISLVLGCFTFILFLRMQRSFRHDLIMLLIQADTFEAMWCFIFPLVSFSRGPVRSESRYCQASGFLLAFGIQSSDFAALLIAIHTGLYIFRGNDGLYPFRTFAYCVWFAFAIIFSSLPFVTSPGYINRSEICYLTFDPPWVRRAFSWIPRYTIFAAILLIYMSIYLNVVFVMKNKSPAGSNGSGSGSGSANSKRQRRRSMNMNQLHASDNLRRGSVPPLPQLRDPGRLSVGSPLDVQDTNGQISHSGDPPELHGDTEQPASSLPEEEVNAQHNSVWLRLTRTSTQLFAKTRRLTIGIFSTHRAASQGSAQSAAVDGSFDSESRAMFRARARRQVRYMFSYPLGYLALWIIPFVSQQLQGRDSSAPPFTIRLLAQVSICLQGALDSIIFLAWEKPWKRPRDHSHQRKRSISHLLRLSLTPGFKVGRTREERQIDMADARARRRRELEDRQQGQRTNGLPINWWDPFMRSIEEVDKRDYGVDPAYVRET